MDSVIPFLIQWGYWGMLVAAFLAGSFFPFSSEAVMLALLAAGLDPWQLVVYGTIGNVLGSMFNYGVGRLGRLDWIERYFHVKKESLDKAERFMNGRSAITIMLGLMRANKFISIVSITIGKFLRYIVLVYGVKLIF